MYVLNYTYAYIQMQYEAVAQSVRAFLPYVEGWVFEIQPRLT